MNDEQNTNEANAVGKPVVGDRPAAPPPLAPTPGSAGPAAGTIAAEILSVMEPGKQVGHITIACILGRTKSRVVMELNKMAKRGWVICHERARNSWGEGIYEKPNP